MLPCLRGWPSTFRAPFSQVHELERDVDRVPGEVMDNEDTSTKEKLGHIDGLMKRLQVPFLLRNGTLKYCVHEVMLQRPVLHHQECPSECDALLQAVARDVQHLLAFVGLNMQGMRKILKKVTLQAFDSDLST
jgi:hypothetical protein